VSTVFLPSSSHGFIALVQLHRPPGKKNRITHRIPITSRADIDAEVKRWLKTAYDMDA
jgi:hypothetical protein